MSAARLPPDIVAAVPVHTLRALLGPRPVTVAPYAAPDDIPPEHVITDRVVLPPAAYEAVVELVKNPPPPTPALVACMAPEEPVTLADAVAMTNLLRDALGDRCRLSAEAADDAAYEDFLRMKAEAHRRADLLAMAGIVAQAIFGWLP